MTFMRRLAHVFSHPLGIFLGTMTWCLLWGSVDLLGVLGGVAVTILVYIAFPMPPLSRELTVRPVAFIVFVAMFLWDLVVSTAEIAWYVVRPSGPPCSSVIAVTLRSRSDLFLTLTGVLATLIPGSVLVEAQRSTGTLFFHGMGVTNQDEAAHMRKRILAQERMALRAFASKRFIEGAGIDFAAEGRARRSGRDEARRGSEAGGERRGEEQA